MRQNKRIVVISMIGLCCAGTFTRSSGVGNSEATASANQSRGFVSLAGNEQREIGYWTAAPCIPSGTSHYWAAFTVSIAGHLRGRLIDSLGVTIIGAKRFTWGCAYLLDVRKRFGEVYDLLKRERGFINLAPFVVSEVVDEGVWFNRDLRYVDSASGLTQAAVWFWKTLTLANATAVLSKYVDAVAARDGLIVATATRDQLLRVAEIEDVRRVAQYYEPRPVNDNSREVTKVNDLQHAHLDTTSIFPPTVAWNLDSTSTGDSVWIGVYGGFDSTRNDLCEQSGGVPLVRRAAIPNYSFALGGPGYNEHDTHCAGIAGGNGWMSDQDSAHGWQYRWRGVAPKARLASSSTAGDVNSVSYVLGSNDAIYDGYDEDLDASIGDHDTATNANRNNVVVYAAANNGSTAPPGYGYQASYYSMLADAKDAVKVGSVDKQTALRSPFSSMGPTRDGRVGPDVMAPGSGSELEKFHFAIDYIRLYSGAGVLKREWNFNNSADGMVAGSMNNDSMRTNATYLSLYGGHGMSISTDTLIPNIYAETNDSLVVRFREAS